MLSEPTTGNTVAANAFGLTAGTGPVPTKAGSSAYDYELTIDGATITATRTPDRHAATPALRRKLAAERLILTGLPDEELLVLISGSGQGRSAPAMAVRLIPRRRRCAT